MVTDSVRDNDNNNNMAPLKCRRKEAGGGRWKLKSYVYHTLFHRNLLFQKHFSSLHTEKVRKMKEEGLEVQRK